MTERSNFPITLLCKVLKVSRTSFYDWLKAKPSYRHKENDEIRQHVSEVYESHKGRYGRRRIAKEINASRGTPISIGRIERRMKEIGVKGYQPRSFKRTTIPDPTFVDSPNLVLNCLASGANQIWVSDISVLQQAA